MKRRQFIAASCLAGFTPLAAMAQESQPAEVAAEAIKLQPQGLIDVQHTGPARQFFELRVYRNDPGAKQQSLEEFFAKAAIPAWNRQGIQPVGVFKEKEGATGDLYVLLPHRSLESLVTATWRLMRDEQFVRAGAAVLDAPLNDPAYKRIEISLLSAFIGMPELEVPTQAETRLLQLRIYESHSVKKGQKKIEMFNAGGEIEIFRRVGLAPVFFGESLAGPKMPNLTYMLGFENQEALDKNWEAFRQDPAWLKLKDDPQYKDTVSNITNLILRPAAGSQI